MHCIQYIQSSNHIMCCIQYIQSSNHRMHCIQYIQSCNHRMCCIQYIQSCNHRMCGIRYILGLLLLPSSVVHHSISQALQTIFQEWDFTKCVCGVCSVANKVSDEIIQYQTTGRYNTLIFITHLGLDRCPLTLLTVLASCLLQTSTTATNSLPTLTGFIQWQVLCKEVIMALNR